MPETVYHNLFNPYFWIQALLQTTRMTSVRNILDDMSIVGKDLESLNGYQRNNYTEHGKQVTNSKVDKLIFSFNECVYQHQACQIQSQQERDIYIINYR